MGIRYVVVPEANAPSPLETGPTVTPEALLTLLDAQLDLSNLDVAGGIVVYRNAAWGPTRAQLPADTEFPSGEGGPVDRVVPGLTDAPTALPDDDGYQSFGGSVDEAGTVYLAEASSGQWQLKVEGQAAERQEVLGWSSSFSVPAGSSATLAFDTPVSRTLMLVGQLVLWLVVLIYLFRTRVRIEEARDLAELRGRRAGMTARGPAAPRSNPALAGAPAHPGADRRRGRRPAPRGRPTGRGVGRVGGGAHAGRPVPESPSSTWYCAGGTATGEKTGAAEQTIEIANVSDADLTARLTAVPSEGAMVERDVPVPARSRQSIVLSSLVVAPYASAVVEADGGQIAVSHVLTGPTGTSTAACSSAPSASWYFPSGTSEKASANRQLLALFNPFPSDAVVAVTFDTDDGSRCRSTTPPSWSPATRSGWTTSPPRSPCAPRSPPP